MTSTMLFNRIPTANEIDVSQIRWTPPFKARQNKITGQQNNLKDFHSLYGLIWHKAKFYIPVILIENEIINLGGQLIGPYSSCTFFPLCPNSFLLLLKVAGFFQPLRKNRTKASFHRDSLSKNVFAPSLWKQELSITIRLSRTWDLRFKSIWRMLQKKQSE